MMGFVVSKNTPTFLTLFLVGLDLGMAHRSTQGDGFSWLSSGVPLVIVGLILEDDCDA
jgi:hypothetical protein